MYRRKSLWKGINDREKRQSNVQGGNIMIVDRLYERVEEKGHVCLGLDTDYSYLPKWFAESFKNKGEAIYNFNKEIIDKTYDSVACFKVQIAYYEALGLEGMNAYKKTLDYIKEKDTIVISDIKRGDIFKTAEMYAKAHFEGDFESDYITLNSYMGLNLSLIHISEPTRLRR